MLKNIYLIYEGMELSTSLENLGKNGASVDYPIIESPQVDERNLLKNGKNISYATGALAGAFILFLFVVLKNAWLSDDSYISLRTVDNLLHGYGLTWNIDERVQTYTHPLWFFLLVGANIIERNIYFSTLALSLTVTTLAVTLFLFRLAPSLKMAIVGLVALTASKAFVDFSTSGLENPMTHLLIILFALLYFRYQGKKHYVLWMSLLGCAMILNRMDTVILFVPTLAYTLWQHRSWRTVRTMALSFLPFIVWELFSLFYYGFLFPNTAYAKLGSAIPGNELFAQGIAYMISSFTFDPLLFLIIAAGLLLAVLQKDWKSLPLMAGMVLYIFYTVKVGGDFMAGRFLTPPFLIAVILLMRNLPETPSITGVTLVVIAIVGILVPNSRIYPVNVQTAQATLIDTRGVADEHLWYASRTNLLNYTRTTPTTNPLAGPPSIYENVNALPDRVDEGHAIGIAGYVSGPKVHIIDLYALSDPLLARLPAIQKNWRIGHFTRVVPAGYVETIMTGQNQIKDKNLAEYYDHLHNVTSGPLLSWSRMVDIWELNTGAYNYLLLKVTP